MTRHHYNLGLLFDESLAAHARRPALLYPDRTIHYDNLSNWIDQLSALLLAKGLVRGDVIAIGHNKRPLSYALMLAGLRLGVAYVNIDVASPVARTLRILETSRPCLLFYDDSAYAEVMNELAGTHSC